MAIVGDKPTGLGAYAKSCAKIAGIFKSKVLGTLPTDCVSAEVVSVPRMVSADGGKFSAILRQLWAAYYSPGKHEVVYSPTHHGFWRASDQIITIHDLICLKYPSQHIFQYIYFKWFMPILVKKCRAIFTVSEASKQHISAVYGVASGKIHVVPNSVNTDIFFPSSGSRGGSFLLMVGARYPHKNVEEVLLNHHCWSGKYKLVVASCSGSYRNKLSGLVEELGLSSLVEFRDYVSIQELVALYSECSAFIYPSKWEGFGIPPLEALSCNRPVIVSDIPVHREVLQDGAIFVQLGCAKSWAEAFRKLDDADFVAVTVGHGRNRVRYYSREHSIACLRESLMKAAPELERA